MKFLVIEFPDTVDLTLLIPDTIVTVTHDATTLSGKVLTAFPLPEPEDHTHEVGPPITI